MSWLTAILVALGLAAPPGPPAFQGYVEAEYVFVASEIGGAVETLAVRRGQTVQRGELLFVLESASETAAAAESDAKLREAEARLDDLRKGRRPLEIDVIVAQRDQAAAQHRLAESELARQTGLMGSPAFNRQKLDDARATRDQWRARVAELDRQIDVARMASREDELRMAEAQVAAARAAADQAHWRLDRKTGVAPADALVADTFYRVGEVVAANAGVVSLLPPENRKVRFLVPQAALARFPVGTRVAVSCDGCGAPIDAEVSWLAPEPEFTPPVLYNRDSRARLVFLVEARPVDRPQRLAPGQPVDVRLASEIRP